MGKSLSNGNRPELLEFLAQGERSAEELSRVAGLTVANTSQHLQQLRQSGLIACRKEGLRLFYRLSGDDVIELPGALRNVAERHLAEVQQLVQTYLTAKDSLEPITRTDLLERARNGLVTILDVRPHEEYAAGHLPGAVNVPLQYLEDHLHDFEHDHEVVAYCLDLTAFLPLMQLSDCVKEGSLQNG